MSAALLVSPSRSTEESPDRWFQKIQSGDYRKWDFARFMLGRVSRTFALNIRVLPQPLQDQVLLAYLFCRAADTLEDDANLPSQTKVSLLRAYRGLFEDSVANPGGMAAFTGNLPSHWKDSNHWDHVLTCHLPDLWELFHSMDSRVKADISTWVIEMCRGMELFANRQGSAASNRGIIRSLRELDQYCYYVAGTVGNMLCDLFSHHSSRINGKRYQRLQQFAVSFGLGLQLTNIVKDVSADLERNVLFLPRSLLDEAGIPPDGVLKPEFNGKMRALIALLIKKAQSHLRDALEFTCALPRLELRLRLFCLWPLFMALDTLVLVAQHAGNPDRRGELKINRKQVAGIIKTTSGICWSNGLVRNLFASRMERLTKAMAAG